ARGRLRRAALVRPHRGSGSAAARPPRHSGRSARRGRGARGADPARCRRGRLVVNARAAGIGLALVTACVSGVSVYVNGHAVKHFDAATASPTAKNAVAGVLLLLLAVGVPRAAGATRVGRASSRGQGPALLAVAVIGGSVPFVLFFEGLTRSEATQAA